LEDLYLLPVLPTAWSKGDGLCARERFVVDLKWEQGMLQSGLINSKIGRK